LVRLKLETEEAGQSISDRPLSLVIEQANQERYGDYSSDNAPKKDKPKKSRPAAFSSHLDPLRLLDSLQKL
jgi:hypothetical protein